MITSEMLTDLCSSSRLDIRGLAVWDEARCLTLAVHELAKDIQGSRESAAAEIQGVCVRLLTKIMEAYDGRNAGKEVQLLGETNGLLENLDRLLEQMVSSGRDVALLRREVLRVRALLNTQFSG